MRAQIITATRKAFSTFTAILLLAGSALAGSWIDTSTTSITRTNVGDGLYRVTFSFRVKTGSTPPFAGGSTKTNLRIVEIDPCFDDKISSAPVCVDLPPSGGTSTLQTYTYFYPCAWGDDIGVEVSNKTGFTGATKEEVNLPVGASADDCGPSTRTGGLPLTPTARANETLRSFFMPGPEEPVIPVTRGLCGTTGADHIGFGTELLPDPSPLDYTFYEITVFDGPQVLHQEILCTAGSQGNPSQIPDNQRRFGKPVRGIEVPLHVLEFASNLFATVDMIDTNTGQNPIRVFQGSFDQGQPEILARAGNLGTANGPSFDALRINGSGGDENRILDVDRSGPFQVSFLSFPGAQGQPYNYAVFAFIGENTAGDLSPHPFGLGAACFPTPLTGGGSITLLNTLGAENLLGAPRIPGTPQGPGTAISIFRPQGLPPIDLTLQAIIPDPFSPNGLAGFSNAVVTRIR